VRILGVDPGVTTGWAHYDSEAKAVISCGHFNGHEVENLPSDALTATVVIERPKGYGPTRPQLVDCGYVAGRLVEWFGGCMECETRELTRLEACKALTAAVHGEVNVRNDSTAWAALVLLHGEGSDRKPKKRKGVVVEAGGAIGGVTSHARAALAVAVAFATLAEKGENIG